MRNLSSEEILAVSGAGFWEDVGTIFDNIGDWVSGVFSDWSSYASNGCDILDRMGGGGICAAGAESIEQQNAIRDAAICVATSDTPDTCILPPVTITVKP